MILVASTIAPFKTVFGEDITWLRNAEMIAEDTDEDVEFFCAIEQDARGDEPFTELLWRLDSLDATIWRFGIDSNTDEGDDHNRLFRICAGRNLAIEYAMRNRECTHILWVDTDTMIPNNSIDKLLELRHAVVGGHVPHYDLDGPQVTKDNKFIYGGGVIPEGADVRAHWNTAGFLMVERRVFTQQVWRYDIDNGLSDDPAFQATACEKFGETWVRHDVMGQHTPIQLTEDGARAYDRKYYR